MSNRLPPSDPRTVGRDIPGILDNLFPQLIPGVVAHFNRKAVSIAGCKPVPEALIACSTLQRAMLFELAVAAGEQLLSQEGVDWDRCLALAVARQRRHFDATVPHSISVADTDAAMAVAKNLAAMIETIRDDTGDQIHRAPAIPGYQWIASGVGDFSIGTRLVEVKCTSKRFSSSDYRQILMYWLLSYAGSLETTAAEWSDVVLLNPRLNLVVKLPFIEIVSVTGAGRSKLEILELFSCIVGDRSPQLATVWLGTA